MQVTGFIENVYENQTKWKWPDGSPKCMYAATVDGTRYSFKNKNITSLKGKYVSFEAEQNGDYWNANPDSLKTLDAPTPKQGVSNGKLPAMPSSDTRQDSIIYQSSRKDAIEMVNAMLAAGLIDFGKAKGAQKMELYEVYVDHYTVRLYNDTKRLAPPEHANPKDAEAPEEAQALARPARKAKAPVEEQEFHDDEIPF